MAPGTEEPSPPSTAIIVPRCFRCRRYVESEQGITSSLGFLFLLIYRTRCPLRVAHCRKSGSLEHVAVRIFSRMTVSPELPKPLCISLQSANLDCQSSVRSCLINPRRDSHVSVSHVQELVHGASGKIKQLRSGRHLLGHLRGVARRRSGGALRDGTIPLRLFSIHPVHSIHSMLDHDAPGGGRFCRQTGLQLATVGAQAKPNPSSTPRAFCFLVPVTSTPVPSPPPHLLTWQHFSSPHKNPLDCSSVS